VVCELIVFDLVLVITQVGNGVGKRTVLDSSYFFRKISVAQGERMAFYIASDESIVRYSTSLKACCEIFVSSPFGSSSKSPRIFNGAIHYETMENANLNTELLQTTVQYSPELVKTVTSNYFSGNSGGFGIMFDVVGTNYSFAALLPLQTI
jgi:hypothetical protein